MPVRRPGYRVRFYRGRNAGRGGGQEHRRQRGESRQQEDRRVIVKACDPTADRTGETQRHVEEHRIGAQGSAAIVRADPADRLDAERREHQGETRARECGSGKGGMRCRSLPEQDQAEAFDEQRGDRHAVAAEAVDGVAEDQPDADEAAAEDRQRQRGIGPAAARVVKGYEGRERAETYGCQRQARAVRHDTRKHALERQALAMTRRHAGLRQRHRQGDEAQREGQDTQRDEAMVSRQRHAQGRAQRDAAVGGDAVP